MMSEMQSKRLTLIGMVIGTAAITWWSAQQWLASGSLSDWRVFLVPLILIVVYAAITGIALTMLSSKWDRLAVITASWATFVLFFPANIWYLSALPLFFLFLMEASRRSRRELEERHKFRVRSVIGVGTKFILLGVFLMVSLGFFSLQAERDVTLQTVSEGVQRSVDSAYDSSIVQRQLDGLSSSVQAQLRRDVARSVDSFVQRWLGPLVPFLPPLLAFALFLILWSLVGLVREPVIWLASGFLTLMKRTGFVSVAEQQVPKEVISL